MNQFWKKFLSICLSVVMLALMIPVISLPTKALSSSSFISNAEHRQYIDMMMNYYISSNSNLQTALNNGKSVVFMFEGGSDNYPSHKYAESSSNQRDQAVCIVVKKVNGSNQIVFYNEHSSSLPSQPSYTSGGNNDGQTTILDGIYSIKTWNHQGLYGALQVNVSQGYYTPPSNPNGVLRAASGINIHTRTSAAAGAPASAWSWGCHLIGYGNDSGNTFNEFMKCVANINYNVWTSYSSKSFAKVTAGQDVGYYVVDRQLALDGMSSIYNSTAISNITAASRSARAKALASQAPAHPTPSLLTVDDFSNETRTSGSTSYEYGYVRPNGAGDMLFSSGSNTLVVVNSLSTAALANKSFANTTYFGVKLINKNAGSLYFNFEPANGSGTTLYISSKLAANNPIWLKDNAGNYSKASISEALTGFGRALVVIPQGFDGTVLIPKGVMATAWDATSAGDCSTLKYLGFFLNGNGTGGADYMLLQSFLADNVGSTLPAGPDVSFSIVDTFECETVSAGSSSNQYGWGRPSGGDILISSGTQTLVSVGGFARSGLGTKNFANTTYFCISIQNQNPGELFLDFAPVAAGGQALFISSKLAAIHPIWLRDSLGNSSVATVTEALSWSGHALVAIPQGFNGTILIPKAVMAASWDAQSPVSFSQLDSLGFFMNGSAAGRDYLLVRDFYADNLSYNAPNVSLSLVDPFAGETVSAGSAANTYGYGRPDGGGDILITSGSGGTSFAAVSGFGANALASADLSQSTYLALNITNLNPDQLFFNFEPRTQDGTTLYISSKLAVYFPIWLRSSSGNMTVAPVTEALAVGTNRALVAIPQGFDGTILIPKTVMSTAWNGTSPKSFSKLSSLGFFLSGNGSGSNNVDYLRVRSFSANAVPSNIPLTEVDSFANETASSGGLTNTYGYGRPSGGDILITSGSGGTSFAAVSGFGANTLPNWDFSNVTYFAFKIANRNSAELFFNYEPRLADNSTVYISSKLAVKYPVLLIDAAGNTSEAAITEALSSTNRALVGIPQGFDGTILIPKAVMGTAWNATTSANISRIASHGFFMSGNGSGSNNVDYLLVRSFHTSGAPTARVTVSYNANGGSGAPGSQTVTKGQTVTLSSTVPTRTHYTFAGWATSASATSAQYAAGASFALNGNMTLYAVWAPIPVSLSYNANGGSGAPATQNGNSGQTFTVSSTVPTRTHYTFAGWATSASATSAQYTAGSTLTLTSNVTLYAVWTPIPVSLSYDANGGSGAPATQNGNSGQTLTVSSTKPTRTGYEFLGWASSAAATSAEYVAGNTVTLTASKVLYAVWAECVNGIAGYTVTLGDNIGVNFYMTLSATALADETAHVFFTLPNGSTSTVYVKDIKDVSGYATIQNGITCYKFSCGIAVKEMSDEITAQLITADGVTEEYTYTVEAYALSIVNHPNTYNEYEIALAKALLNYGASAQAMFGYKTDALANRALDETDKVIPAVDPATLESYTKHVSDAIDGVTYKGTSAVWKTNTIIRHYFDITGENITFKLYRDDGTFVGDLEAQPGAYGQCVAIDGIVAKDMATTFRLVVSNGTDEQTISLSVYSYFYDILNDTTGRYSEAEQTAIKAAYHYSQVAIAYLEHNNNA